MARFPTPSASVIAWSSVGIAVLVLSSGIILARKSESSSQRPPGNRADDSFRQMVLRIDHMEQLWQQALEAEATKSLEENRISRVNTRPPEVTGIIQRSYLNSNRLTEDHTKFSTSTAPVPILRRFAGKGPSEWIFDENILTSSGRFVESQGKPLAYAKGDGTKAVVLILDRLDASKTVVESLIKITEEDRLSEEQGAFQWIAPTHSPFLSIHSIPETNPHEISRHTSLFGPWEMRRWYPVIQTVHYHPPTIAGAFTISALVAMGGILSAISQKRAASLAEERVSFVNRVSHELRSPLTNLLLNTDLAMDQLSSSDDRIRRRLRLIREETGRLARIVENVLVFAKMERRQLQITGATCDPQRLISEAVENFQPQFQRKGIHCEIGQQISGRMHLDGDALSQIISNLLSNIEKYAGEHSSAKLLSRLDGDSLIIEVSDSGPGVAEKAKHRIFLPFERANQSTSEGVSGTGLGLAISRELADRMNGKLDLLDSNSGATFRLTLPVKPAFHS